MSEIQVSKPEKIQVVTPAPYYNIDFRMNTRKFRNVLGELWELWKESGIDDDFSNGYYSEKCDFEGDLEKIIIYNSKSRPIEPFLKLVLEAYGGNREEMGDMNLVLTN